MKRRGFLKALGLGATTAATVPMRDLLESETHRIRRTNPESTRGMATYVAKSKQRDDKAKVIQPGTGKDYVAYDITCSGVMPWPKHELQVL